MSEGYCREGQVNQKTLKKGRTGHHEFFGMLYSSPKVADVVCRLLKGLHGTSAFGVSFSNVQKGAGLKQTILKRLELVTSMT